MTVLHICHSLSELGESKAFYYVKICPGSVFSVHSLQSFALGTQFLAVPPECLIFPYPEAHIFDSVLSVNY